MQSYRTGSLDGRERGIDLLERRRVQEALRARLFGGKPAPVCVGRFELQRRLGAGAMGIVYEAHDPQLRRQVALKMLNGVALQEGEAFFHEAQALARLSHPNVLQIHEAGVHEDAPFLVSELMHGGTLRSWMSEARPWREVLRMLIQVGRGLHAAHQRGLVHRDIKPENVLIGADGQPRVADFGLALVPSPLSYHESHQPIAGTPRYMAPEQMRGERVEPASDQFSFCVMAFEALYGAFPFEGATSADVLGAIEAEALRTPPARHPAAAALPALRRGLRASAAARHPSMA
jgi:serine/threonine protein kinase